jgi:transcriptional regulator with XRE-family HTH domain
MANRTSLEEMTPAQCRMARAALKIGVRELAEIANVSTNTITRFEQDEPLRPRTIDAIRGALEQYGAVFMDRDLNGGPGVRLALWHSAVFQELVKRGYTPPRLVSISEQTIRLEAGINRTRIEIDVDRMALQDIIKLFPLDDRITERIIQINLSSFGTYIAKLVLEDPLEFESVGQVKKHLAIGAEALRDMDFQLRFGYDYDDDVS